MSNLARKHQPVMSQAATTLQDHIDKRSSEDRSWFREFLNAIFSSPDLDYSKFEKLESKKTRPQVDLRKWY